MINKERIKSISERVAGLWGEPAQLGMMVEECAELIVAIHHYGRGKCPREDVIEEIADVLVVACQLAATFAPDGAVEAAVNLKLSRLNQRIDNSQGAEPWTHIKNS